MFGTSLRTRSLAVAVVAATTMLGACITIPAPGGGGGGGGPAPAPQPGPQTSIPCEQRVGANGGRGFWDIGLGQCWSCPAGSNRTIFDVRGADACQVGGLLGSMVPAEYLGGS